MASKEAEINKSINPALDPDNPNPERPGLEFAQFGAGCFWGVELAFQRVPGVVKTEVGYSQGHVDNPDYVLVCTGTTEHVEVVRIQFDPAVCDYSTLLSLFWARHDPTSLNRQVRLHIDSHFLHHVNKLFFFVTVVYYSDLMSCSTMDLFN